MTWLIPSSVATWLGNLQMTVDDFPLPRGVVRECIDDASTCRTPGVQLYYVFWGRYTFKTLNLIILHSHFLTHQSSSALAVEFSIKIAKYSRIESVQMIYCSSFWHWYHFISFPGRRPGHFPNTGSPKSTDVPWCWPLAKLLASRMRCEGCSKKDEKGSAGWRGRQGAVPVAATLRYHAGEPSCRSARLSMFAQRCWLHRVLCPPWVTPKSTMEPTTDDGVQGYSKSLCSWRLLRVYWLAGPIYTIVAATESVSEAGSIPLLASLIGPSKPICLNLVIRGLP